MTTPSRRRDARWRGPLELLDVVRRRPGITRADAARDLGWSSGSATEITARLREHALLDEVPVPASGRGRPTSALVAHPDGPVVLAVDLRHEDWRTAVAGLDGVARVGEPVTHRTTVAEEVVDRIADSVARTRRRLGARLRVVSVAAAATVQNGRLVQASTLGWHAVDLTALAEASGAPVLVGNDATLAGVAEARSGASAGAGTALHLIVEVGVGGALVIDGRPQTGATGAGGEYGHLPFGDPGSACPCGAHGCWDLEVDGRALARHLGLPAPADARSFARRTLARAPAEPTVREAVDRVATCLGSGTAALVNALDPDVVTLGGLAVPLREVSGAAFARGYRDGLMSFRRRNPPPVQSAALGDDGPLRGAIDLGLDQVLTEAGLAAWAAEHPRRSVRR